jgi:hypothetical protein
MTLSVKILLVATFVLSAVTGLTQVASAQDEKSTVKGNKTETVTENSNADINKGDDGQAQNDRNKNKSVKQVKSARPDMSRSRGARPPDIVRPSGSRIPRGVGRPAGAGRHGRG